VKPRLLAFGLCAIATALVACGGGGGQTNGPNPPTTTTITPTPSPTPYAFGDSMTFAGTQTTAATFAYPSPSPYPSTNTSVTISQAVTVGASRNPFGSSTAGDFHSVETDVSALVAHTVTTDAWMGLSGSSLVEYGYKSVDESNDSLSAQFPSPIVLDQFPETNGATWSNTAKETLTENDADGTSSTRTYLSDGTYTENTKNAKIGINTTITQAADGSGSIAANGLYLGANVDTITFTAPSGGQIAIAANYVQPPTPSPAPSGQPSPTPAPTIAPRVYTAPAWYGTGTPSLYSQQTVVTTGVAYPQSCSVPAAYGTSGNKLVQTTTRLDTILGYTDTQTQTTYTNAQYGPVCVTISDVQKDYYDYQDDFAAADGEHFHFPGVPLSTTTIQQTLTLQAGAVVHAAARHTQSSAAQTSSISAAQVASAMAAVTLRAERARHERIARFVQTLVKTAKENR
jgi:hypothetical protein